MTTEKIIKEATTILSHDSNRHVATDTTIFSPEDLDEMGFIRTRTQPDGYKDDIVIVLEFICPFCKKNHKIFIDGRREGTYHITYNIDNTTYKTCVEFENIFKWNTDIKKNKHNICGLIIKLISGWTSNILEISKPFNNNSFLVFPVEMNVSIYRAEKPESDKISISCSTTPMVIPEEEAKPKTNFNYISEQLEILNNKFKEFEKHTHVTGNGETGLPRTLKPLEKEFQYYIDHQDQLVAMYDGQFIVIKDGNVIGVYYGMIEAIEDTMKEHELGTFLVQKCEEGEESYTMTFHSRVGG